MENLISTNELQYYYTKRDQIQIAFKNETSVRKPEPFSKHNHCNHN